ncbi:MAG: Uma2 family endonuclease [Gammaproteobacteria bacterium]
MPSSVSIQNAKHDQPVYEQQVVVRSVSWETYEKLLADLIDQSSPRLYYDRGTLEIMSPSAEHERANRLLALLIDLVAEELDIDIESLGSTTFKREDLARGFEPDSCFYVQNESRIRGKNTPDLTIDPPPDLIVEIDITNGSLEKFPLYAEVGVPEIWRYDGRRFCIHQLTVDHYIESETSAVFPLVTRTVIAESLMQSTTLGRTALIRTFREKIRALREP